MQRRLPGRLTRAVIIHLRSVSVVFEAIKVAIQVVYDLHFFGFAPVQVQGLATVSDALVQGL